MAPIGSLENRLNIASLAGTWIGSVLTAVGVVAVVTQLRSVLSTIIYRQSRFVIEAAGIWARCISDKEKLPLEGGLREATAPAFAGWLQHAYLNGGEMMMTQADRSTGGTSCWSKLFAQCNVTPDDLIRYGGPEAMTHPTGGGDPRREPQADILIADGKIFYGFSQVEFAALVILTAFEPMQLQNEGPSRAISFPGNLYLAEHGPFSQVAHFDPHFGNREMSIPQQRFVHRVPVIEGIEYSLGIIRTPNRPSRKCLVLPFELEPADLDLETYPYAYFQQLPNAFQIRRVRYGIESMCRTDGGDLVRLSQISEAEITADIAPLRSLSDDREILLVATAVAHALYGLKPWALTPTIPAYLGKAFRGVLWPLTGSRAETIGELCRFIRDPERPIRVPSGWKDANDLAERTDRLGDVRVDFFNNSSNYCAYYWQAMTLVFDAYDVTLDAVRVAMAEQAVMNILRVRKDQVGMKVRDMLGASETATKGVPEWAVAVYATYVVGWFGDCVDVDLHVLERFRRRVFLG